mmetsp:Transcript_6271/g.25314  ORF Transcript_6271/g.25314 Transcript_6271/m.25314 type:complete len:348 (-) Transcript_6271:78-1121(-)
MGEDELAEFGGWHLFDDGEDQRQDGEELEVVLQFLQEWRKDLGLNDAHGQRGEEALEALEEGRLVAVLLLHECAEVGDRAEQDVVEVLRAQELPRVRPSPRVHRQQRPQCIVQLDGDASPVDLGGELLDVALVGEGVALVVQQPLSRVHLVGHAAQRECVAQVVVALGVDVLRREIVEEGRGGDARLQDVVLLHAGGGVGALAGLVAGVGREVEAAQLPLALARHEDAEGRHVAVDDARVVVQEVDALRHVHQPNLHLERLELEHFEGAGHGAEVGVVAQDVGEGGEHGLRLEHDHLLRLRGRPEDGEEAGVAQLGHHLDLVAEHSQHCFARRLGQLLELCLVEHEE